jgi:hypothetical protein
MILGDTERPRHPDKGLAMLAEKFCLVLETLRDRNDSSRVVSTSPHIPVLLAATDQAATKNKPAR